MQFQFLTLIIANISIILWVFYFFPLHVLQYIAYINFIELPLTLNILRTLQDSFILTDLPLYLQPMTSLRT